YWAELRPLRESRKCWEGAIHALEERIQRNESSDRIAEQTLDRIFALPWYSGLRGFNESDVEGLVNLCKPTVWLKTTEINQMLEILDDDEMLQIRGIRVVSSDCPRNITRAYKDGDYDRAPRYRQLRMLGETFANGHAKEMATIANVDGDHWVAVIVDFASRTIYYFDSAKRPINVDLRAAYDWWIDQHHHTEFDWIPLPCLQQRDGYNCGLFAANRVAYYINPKKYPLLDPQACENERLYMLAKILDRHESLS
ncbi:hypothetical protein K438DRAFT_1536317, partial [Mycena galopus ATCC 62051]